MVVNQEELFDTVGSTYGPSSWMVVDQAMIDRFAAATLDDQFIHCDPVAAAETPLGGTVAHGFLSLSLVPYLAREIGCIPVGAKMALNYGLDRLRFVHPVASGSRVRLHLKVSEVIDKGDGRVLVRQHATLEIEDQTDPALVADLLMMFIL